MSNSKPIQIQGTLSTIIDSVFTPVYGSKAIFTNLRFNNRVDANYTLYLYYKSSDTAQPFLLYQFELDAGDVVNDDTVYEVPYGGYLSGFASVNSVQFVINGSIEQVIST
jgi:hypothetical protein